MKQGHVPTTPRRWQGWRIKGPTFPVELIITRPLDRSRLAERELAATERTPLWSPDASKSTETAA
jgi:hypothetical protein